MSLQAVSKHLKVLEEADLVTRGRDAQRRPVHLDAEVFDLMTTWIERYRRWRSTRPTAGRRAYRTASSTRRSARRAPDRSRGTCIG